MSCLSAIDIYCSKTYRLVNIHNGFRRAKVNLSNFVLSSTSHMYIYTYAHCKRDVFCKTILNGNFFYHVCIVNCSPFYWFCLCFICDDKLSPFILQTQLAIKAPFKCYFSAGFCCLHSYTSMYDSRVRCIVKVTLLIVKLESGDINVIYAFYIFENREQFAFVICVRFCVNILN